MIQPMSYQGADSLNRHLIITNIPSYKVSDAGNELICLKAEKYKLAGALLSPVAVGTALQRLAGTGISVGGTVSYPSGTANTAGKAADIRDLAAAGADMICVVLQIGKLRDGKDDIIREELEALREYGAGKVKMAVIESGGLSEAEKSRVVNLASEAHIDWLVSGTGFKENMVPFPTVNDIACLVKAAGDRIGIAAMGGIETRQQALDMLNAGAKLVISEQADIIYGGHK